MRHFFIFTITSLLSYSAIACSQSRLQAWETAVNGVQPNVNATLESISQQYNVRIERGFIAGSCQEYRILDSDGTRLGEIPIRSNDISDFVELDRRVGHLLKTDRQTLRRLSAALGAYVEDSISMRNRFGISTVGRADLPELSGAGVRFPLTAMTCRETESRQQVWSGPNAMDASVSLNHIAYRPDVTEYPEHRIYTAGELERRLFADQAATAAALRVQTINLTLVQRYNSRGDQGGRPGGPCSESRSHMLNFLMAADHDVIDRILNSQSQPGAVGSSPGATTATDI